MHQNSLNRHERMAAIGFFVAINLLVLANVILHDPSIAYDAIQHLSYINVLAQGRLPEPSETAQFFAPPMPYALPALLQYLHIAPFLWIIKIAQIFNFLLSLGITWLLWRLCERLRPGNFRLKTTALLILAMMAAHHRSMVMVRGEPWLAFFTLLSMNQAVGILNQKSPKLKNTLTLAASLAGLALSRQWGILVWPAIAATIFFNSPSLPREADKMRGSLLKPEIKAIIGAFAIALSVSGWFYARLYFKFGSATAFNRVQETSWKLSNQPKEFYVGRDWNKLFTDPIRPSLANQFPLIFYSDLWGDYWGYFSVYGWDKNLDRYIPGIMLESRLRNGATPEIVTNRYQMAQKLGHANIAGIIPSLLIFAGFIGAVIETIKNRYLFASREQTLVLALLILAFSMAGYLWFLIGHPDPKKGDTIKAGYMLQILPLLAILGADALEKIKSHSKRPARILLLVLGVAAIHNTPLLLTRNNIITMPKITKM
ncbi:MAG: hypothetical protein HY547_05430 [Elusimicrobia bacterium]|nr:hypothetical protein [Elusimicrobiota bacterium]